MDSILGKEASPSNSGSNAKDFFKKRAAISNNVSVLIVFRLRLRPYIDSACCGVGASLEMP